MSRRFVAGVNLCHYVLVDGVGNGIGRPFRASTIFSFHLTLFVRERTKSSTRSDRREPLRHARSFAPFQGAH